MAKNYTFGEAVEILANNTDKEAVMDIGRRYPLLVVAVMPVITLAKDSFVELANQMPEYLTANKVNSVLKSNVAETTEEDEEETPEAPKAKTKEKKAPKTKAPADDDTESDESDDTDYESMNGKQLWALLGERGLRKQTPSTKKADMIATLKAADAQGTGEAADEEEDEAEETESNPYEGKTAMELFKECKKRGLKVKPKQKTNVYIDALLADDEKNSANESEEDDDDWDDEPAPAPKKEKKAPKKEKKQAPKPADDDDDDDWDI